MIILDQLLAHLSAVAGRLLKDERDGVLADVKDPSAGANAVAFGKGFENAVNRLFIGVESSEDAMVAGAELAVTSPASIIGCSMRPVITNQFEVSLDGLASVRALQTRSQFHRLAPTEKIRLRVPPRLSNLHQ